MDSITRFIARLFRFSSAVLFSFFFAACAPSNPDQGSSVRPAATNEPCPQRMQMAFDSAKAAQLSSYSTHGSPVPTEPNQPKLMVGSSGRAVLLVHGFISSPNAMKDLASAFAAKGFTVYSVLLTGYASDARAANSTLPSDWEKSVEDAVGILKLCHSDISIVAHSLGAALVLDEVEYHHLTGISHFAFLAPYLKLSKPWPVLLTAALAGRVDSIDVGQFQASTGIDPYNYLPLPPPQPGDPPAFIPVEAMKEVVDFKSSFANPGPVPLAKTFLAYSEADQVIDGAYAKTYLTALDPALSTFEYPQSEGIGHSIEDRATNPHFDALLADLEGFLSQ